MGMTRKPSVTVGNGDDSDSVIEAASVRAGIDRLPGDHDLVAASNPDSGEHARVVVNRNPIDPASVFLNYTLAREEDGAKAILVQTENGQISLSVAQAAHLLIVLPSATDDLAEIRRVAGFKE